MQIVNFIFMDKVILTSKSMTVIPVLTDTVVIGQIEYSVLSREFNIENASTFSGCRDNPEATRVGIDIFLGTK